MGTETLFPELFTLNCWTILVNGLPAISENSSPRSVIWWDIVSETSVILDYLFTKHPQSDLERMLLVDGVVFCPSRHSPRSSLGRLGNADKPLSLHFVRVVRNKPRSIWRSIRDRIQIKAQPIVGSREPFGSLFWRVCKLSLPWHQDSGTSVHSHLSKFCGLGKQGLPLRKCFQKK